MRNLSVVLLLLTTVGCFAQTVKVIALDKDDANTALALQKDLKLAQQRIADFNVNIQHKYISYRVPTIASVCIIPPGQTGCTPPQIPLEDKLGPDKSWQLKEGWENGFKFSEDYKFIVPKARVDINCICGGSSGPTTCPCSPMLWNNYIHPVIAIPAGNSNTWR